MKNPITLLFKQWGFTFEGVRNNKNGEWWLFSQLFIILAHFYPPIISDIKENLLSKELGSYLGILIFFGGTLISLAALISLGESLSPLPEPKQKAILITNNIYKYSRHPLYLGIIIISVGINIAAMNIFGFILFFALSYILINKAKIEEKRLLLKYADYYKYSTTTPAIIKGLYLFDWSIKKNRGSDFDSE